MRKKGWIVSGVLLGGVLLVLILGMERGNAPGLVLFFGRFHPTVVHFPIALLLLGAAIELFAPRVPWVAQVRPAVPFILALGALSALVSMVLGYLLSLDGGYEEQALSLHMWLGIAVTIVASALALVAAWSRQTGRVFRAMTVVMAVFLVTTGHLGGSLARGDGYLTYYLPATVKTFVGIGGGEPDGLIAEIDSALVYDQLVQPILNRRCVTCHGPNKSKGDLRLDSRPGIEDGGRDGPAYVAGNPAQSEIVRRITLPPQDEDAMPPDGGPPLDVGETEVIRWWIANGASFDARVAAIDQPPSAVGTYLARVSQPRAPRRSGIFALDVPAADSGAIALLRESGLIVTPIAPDAPFLEVDAVNVRAGFHDAAFETLQSISEQVSILDASNTQLTDRSAALLSEMPHLTRLRLDGTQITDATLASLISMEHLEYLNLYDTAVSDTGIARLGTLPSLRDVYLWRTEVSEQGASALRAALRERTPGAEVHLEHQLIAATDSTTIQ